MTHCMIFRRQGVAEHVLRLIFSSCHHEFWVVSTCVRGSVTECRGRAWRLGAGRALRLHVLASFSLAALNLSCFSIPPPHSLAHWAFFQMLTLCRFPAVQLKPQISRSLFLPGASEIRLFTATMPERLVWIHCSPVNTWPWLHFHKTLHQTTAMKRENTRHVNGFHLIFAFFVLLCSYFSLVLNWPLKSWVPGNQSDFVVPLWDMELFICLASSSGEQKVFLVQFDVRLRFVWLVLKLFLKSAPIVLF